MRKLLAILVAAMMLLSLVACGNNDNLDPSDNDNTGISQGDENTSVGEYKDGKGEKWGENEYLTPYFPPVDESKIIGTLNNSEGSYIIYMDWTLEEAEAYIEACKEAGYTYEWVNHSRTDSDGNVIYSWNYSLDAASNKQVKLNNDTDDGSWCLTLMK